MWKKVKERFSSIRSVLLSSYFVIILICIVTVGVASFYISYKSMSDNVETTSFQIVRQIEKNMDNDLHSKRNLLLASYYSQDYIDDINAYLTMGNQAQFLFRQRLGDLYLKSFNITPIRDFVRFSIYYSNGELLNSSHSTSQETPEQVRRSNWFRDTAAKDGKVNFITESPVERQSDKLDIAYSTAIVIRDFSNPDEFLVVRADYNSGLFQSIVQDVDLSRNSAFLILNEQNNPIYVSEGYPDSLQTGIFTGMEGDSGKFWFDQEGKRWFVSYTKSAYSNWKTVLLMPREEIFSPLDSIKKAALYTALFAFFITFILSIVFGRMITKPILHLYKTVNHIKRGDFSVRVESNRTDEIGRIAMNFNAMQDELQRLIENRYIYQIKLQEARLAMLYSQINPHFLYNTLDSIKAMADYYKVGEISEMAQSLADMFRYNIKNSEEIVTLREELEQIEAYIKIQSFRFEDKFDYQVKVDDSLYEFKLLKMTLQPLVENAVFHGIEPKKEKGIIMVSVWREDDRVYLTVSDDGVGIEEEKLRHIQSGLAQPFYQEEFADLSTTGSGIGMRNVYARYAIRYGRLAEFAIESTKESGTCITLILHGENKLL